MSFYGRERGTSPPHASPPAAFDPPHSSVGTGTTHVAPGTRVSGTISGKAPLRIDGEVIGEVHIEAALTVGAEGRVEGPVEAKSVVVAGRLVGDVTAADRVEIASTGSVEGTVATPSFVTAEGAFFKGRVEMMRGSDAAAAEIPKNREARRAKAAGEAKKVESEREGTPRADRNS